MTNPFVFFSNKLSQVEIYNDVLKDFEFYNHISSFELHVFGIVNQYQRIQEVLKQTMSSKEESLTSRNNNLSQIKLDMYYFVLTWDKLKKIFKIIKSQINKIIKEGKTTNNFITDYKSIRKRIENLLGEYNKDRNEYEHPSLEPHRKGKIISFGNIFFNGTEISVHVGRDVYGTIKKTHIEQLESLRIELLDLFIKHFTNKMLTSDLIKSRDDFINDIENNYMDYKEIVKGNNHKLSNELFNKLVMTETFFYTEGIPLPDDVHDKICNIIF